MGAYTTLTKADAKKILTPFQLGELVSLTPLSLGISNTNYRVEIKSADSTFTSFLLKISDDKGEDALKKEQKILDYLKKLSYPFSIQSLKIKNNQSIFHFKDKVGVLFPFLKGIPPGPSDSTCKDIGFALAKLHTLHLDKESRQIRNHEEVGFGPQAIVEYIKTPFCPIDFKDYFNEIFPDSLDTFINEKFDKGIIHGDLYYDNVLFHNDRLSNVLDFEQSGMGLFIFDLGISISGSCLEKGQIITPLVLSYLTGYEAERPLPEKERAHLNVAILLGLFSISLWRIKRFREGTLDPGRRDSYQELLKRALDYNSLL